MKKIIQLSLLTLLIQLEAKEIYALFDVHAHQKSNIAFHSSGVIEEIYVQIGDKVQKGDKIAKLENSDTKALLNIAEVSFEYAHKDLERQKKVKQMIDKGKFDSFVYKYDNAKYQLEYQKSLFKKTLLKAPFDGTITAKEVEIGDVVNAMMLKIAFTIESHPVKLVLKFDSKYWKDIQKGDIFRYTLDGDKTEYTALISKIYPNINTSTRMMSAEVEVKNIPVGLFGTGYILTKKD